MVAAALALRMMRALALAALLLLPGCLSGPAEPEASTPPPTFPTPPPTFPTPPTPPSPTPAPTRPTPSAPAQTAEADDLVAANTRFAWEAFRSLSAASPGENLVVSPYSISTALQMLLGGAGGTTERAMVGALRLGNAYDGMDEAAAALLADLTRSDPNVTLRIGNSVWIDETFAPEVNASFPARIQQRYQGGLFERDFRDEATVDAINAWASNATEGKIDRVLRTIDPDEILFLLNAVYFNGTWARSFNESCTHGAPFTRDDGSSVQVDMMCGATGHAFAEDAESTVARLPYGDGRVAMYLVLPANGTDLDTFAVHWDGAFPDAYSPYVELEMPRLKLATRELDLRPTLREMGMAVAFTDQANLTGIAESLYVSRVTHDAVMEVDERGTVAAAVTNVGVGITSVPPPPKHLVFDRPFLVVIRDDATGTILFMAKVHDPTA